MQTSLFHERWWLTAVTGGRYEECRVHAGENLVGRLPFLLIQRGRFRTLRMPPFTHLLGPVVDAGTGKQQTRIQKRLSITRSLVDQLPKFSYFHQHIDPSIDGGLAIVDGLAFQERQFEVATQYTVQVDCRKPLEDLFAAMYLKTRQHIRRADKEYTVRCVENAGAFLEFYLRNLNAGDRKNRIDFTHFGSLHSETKFHECGAIFGAFDKNGSPVAMTFLVWGYGIMYYLLSTRDIGSPDSGATSLLLWHAMKRAHEMGLLLDLDGVYSSGTVRFLTNFGGEVRTRLVVRRTRGPLYGALQYVKRQVAPDESRFFT